MSSDVCNKKGQLNLLSVSQIKNGGQVKFNGNSCVIVNNKKVIVATASLINNMYRVNMPNGYACMSNVDEKIFTCVTSSQLICFPIII